MFWFWSYDDENEHENSSSLHTTTDHINITNVTEQSIHVITTVVSRTLAPWVLILLPALEFYLLYRIDAYNHVARVFDQLSSFSEQEKNFILAGFYQELQCILIAVAFCYGSSVLCGHLFGPLPSPFFAIVAVFLITFSRPNSFFNNHERVNIPKLERVIMQLYVILAVFTPVPFVILFDTTFLCYLPVPSHSNLRFKSIHETSEEIPLPQWFTLSRLLHFLLPCCVYTGINFLLAHFCFLIWCRAFYYALGRDFMVFANNEDD